MRQIANVFILWVSHRRRSPQEDRVGGTRGKTTEHVPTPCPAAKFGPNTGGFFLSFPGQNSPDLSCLGHKTYVIASRHFSHARPQEKQH